MSGSCKLFKESLAPEIVTELEKTGCCVVPIPEAIKKHKEKLAMKACQQYALDAYADNIVLLDTGLSQADDALLSAGRAAYDPRL